MGLSGQSVGWPEDPQDSLSLSLVTVVRPKVECDFIAADGHDCRHHSLLCDGRTDGRRSKKLPPSLRQRPSEGDRGSRDCTVT